MLLCLLWFINRSWKTQVYWNPFLVLRKFHFYLWTQWQEISCSVVEGDQNVGKENKNLPISGLGNYRDQKRNKNEIWVFHLTFPDLCALSDFCLQLFMSYTGQNLDKKGTFCSQISSFGIQERDDKAEDPTPTYSHSAEWEKQAMLLDRESSG